MQAKNFYARTAGIALLLVLSLTVQAAAQAPQDSLDVMLSRPDSLAISLPNVVLAGIPFSIEVTAFDRHGHKLPGFDAPATISGIKREDATPVPAFANGVLRIDRALIENSGRKEITVATVGRQVSRIARVIPGILSLVPPIVAILLAVFFRQVLLSLFLGIWLGAVFVSDFSIIAGFLRTVDKYFVNALADSGHASIIMFSMTLGGMVGIISKGGGMQGIVESIRKYANHRRGGQLSAWLMGLLIFFDDYANTLIVGNTLRPFTDKLHVSREKLSYIVDTTAAPVASVALISTWIGYQIGLIDQAFASIGVPHDAYFEFLRSIPYASYSLFAIIFVFFIGYTLRDFGPMLTAERRAVTTGKVLQDNAQPLMDTTALDTQADAGTPLRWYNGLLPIIGVIIVTIGGLYYSGLQELGDAARDAQLREIFSAANSYAVLMWAAFSGVFLAAVMVLSQRILSLTKTIDAMLSGYRAMVLAAIILVMAWSIGDICKDLHTADYVIGITRGFLSPHFLPALTFTIAAFIGFATGTSWATMAILVPIVIPIAYSLPDELGLHPDVNSSIILSTIGAVLSGAVFGDHCSPISDTTIMSSMASGADHIDHVRTQMPYALVVALIAIVCGYLPAGYGIAPWLTIPLGTVVMFGVVVVFGKKTEGAGNCET